MKRISISYLITALLGMTFLSINAQDRSNPSNQSEELGKVSWYRDYQTAIKLAKTQNKAVLILFQEVPGCATCRNYGHDVLSNPLMTEVIENLFVPLAVYNNKGGKDKLVLTQFNEPSWNNPVVRIVNADGNDLVKRVAGNYSAIGLYQAMEQALKLQNKPLPEYMKLLGAELSSSNTGTLEEKYYKMYCFWTGEKHLGSAQGVLATESGFMGGHEVVKVTYDPQLINEIKLTNYAKKENFAPIKNDGSYLGSAKDHYYYLQHTNYKYLPLSELQKTKINSALGYGKPANRFLSPKQLIWLGQLNAANGKKEILYNRDFAVAWAERANYDG